MKFKALAATLLSLSLLASSSAVFAASANAGAASQPARQTDISSRSKMEVSQPKPAGTQGSQDIAKQRRTRKILVWVGGTALVVAIVAASNHSSSGTTGTTAP